MIKMPIAYTDLDGNECEEEYLFNLTKLEIVDMDSEYDEGLEAFIKKASDNEDKKALIRVFKDVILKGYGYKSEDGKRFIKTEKATNEFAQSVAYSELFMKIVSDPDLAEKFINGVIPKVDK